MRCVMTLQEKQVFCSIDHRLESKAQDHMTMLQHSCYLVLITGKGRFAVATRGEAAKLEARWKKHNEAENILIEQIHSSRISAAKVIP